MKPRTTNAINISLVSKKITGRFQMYDWFCLIRQVKINNGVGRLRVDLLQMSNIKQTESQTNRHTNHFVLMVGRFVTKERKQLYNLV